MNRSLIKTCNSSRKSCPRRSDGAGAEEALLLNTDALSSKRQAATSFGWKPHYLYPAADQRICRSDARGDFGNLPEVLACRLAKRMSSGRSPLAQGVFPFAQLGRNR